MYRFLNALLWCQVGAKDLPDKIADEILGDIIVIPLFLLRRKLLASI